MKGRMITVSEAKKLMKRPIKRSARSIAKALECYRMASDEKKHDCTNIKCPYNNNSTYGNWCCANSIMFDAIRKLRQQAEEIKKLKGRDDIFRDQMAIISDMTGQEKESLIREAWRIAIEKLGK